MTNDQRQPPRTEEAPDVRGNRVLHVILPREVFNHVKAQAALSGMAFKQYLERYLREAYPYTVKDLQDADSAAPNSSPT